MGLTHRPRVLDADRQARAELRRAVDSLHDAEVATKLRRRTPRAWWVLTVLLVAAALVAAGVGITALIRSESAYAETDFENTALAEVRLLLGPDPAAPDRAREILDNATGGFYDGFAQSAESYTQFVRRSGTVGAVTVDGSGLSRRSGDDAVVLVAATVRYTGGDEQTPDASSRQFRLRVYVTPDADRLKVGQVQYLP